jgi:hypothetical protein
MIPVANSLISKPLTLHLPMKNRAAGAVKSGKVVKVFKMPMDTLFKLFRVLRGRLCGLYHQNGLYHYRTGGPAMIWLKTQLMLLKKNVASDGKLSSCIGKKSKLPAFKIVNVAYKEVNGTILLLLLWSGLASKRQLIKPKKRFTILKIRSWISI